MIKVTASRVWAPISPVTKRGTRWINYSCLAATKRDARRALCRDWIPGSQYAEWSYWRERGWTIERVTIEAVS